MKDFKKMKYVKLFESFTNDSELKSWAYNLIKEPSNHSGLNSYEDAVEELDIFFEHEYNDFQSEFELIRVLQIDVDEEIDVDDLGSHYIDPSYEDRIYERGWYDSINIELDDSQKLYLVKVKANYDMVDWEDTIHNRLSFPREFEITLKDNPEVISIEEIDQDNIN